MKKPTLSELQMTKYRLLHSFIVEGKKEFLKKFCTNLGSFFGVSCQIELEKLE